MYVVCNYVFDLHCSEYRNKEFINEDSADNSMINYTQSKTFFFHKETSNPNVSESDTICTISIPMVVSRLEKQ